MKQNFNSLKAYFKKEIFMAKANDYEAILLPNDFDCEPYFLDNVEDEEHIYDIAYDLGWDSFLIIDLINEKESFKDLYELEIA